MLDLKRRRLKTQKIEILLGLDSPPLAHRPLRILDVGCGSGGIAHYFANHPRLTTETHAADLNDERQIRGGYSFHRLDGTQLPFVDESFDLVITNHVIEHVGKDEAKHAHLREVRRVLKDSGQVYLAVPNRWQLVEPHYRLACLSWLPERWRSPYLRFRKRGTEYDCFPPTLAESKRLFNEVGFNFQQHCGSALKTALALEKPSNSLLSEVLMRVPNRAYDVLGYIFPTLIFTLRKSSEENSPSDGVGFTLQGH